MSPQIFQPRVLKRFFNQGIPLATPSSSKKEHSMKRACSLFLTLLLALFLNGCSDSNEQPEAVTGAGDAPTTAAASNAPAPGYNQSATYKATGVAHAHRGRGSTFRIPQKGTYFGKSIKVVFSNGWSIVVPDTSKRYASGNFIYRPGIGTVRSGTGTAHGGVFIAANTGNRSKTVKILYNK